MAHNHQNAGAIPVSATNEGSPNGRAHALGACLSRFDSCPLDHCWRERRLRSAVCKTAAHGLSEFESPASNHLRVA